MVIYTIGGGEIIYNIMQAVALCLNGGGGLLNAFLRIGGLVGAFIAYYIILYGSPWEIIKSWGLPVLLIMHMFFVPSTTVWVKDTITNYSYKVDNVPYGLAVFASQTSQLGKGITEIIEQNFQLPDNDKMTYQKTGMLFGSNIMEQAKTFKITNSEFKENMRNFVGQCIKYDIMLNHKYTFDQLRNTDDIWKLVSSNPSENRGIHWLPIGGGRTQYMTCAEAVSAFEKLWADEYNRSYSLMGRKFFSGRFLNRKDNDPRGFQMDPTVEQAMRGEISQHLANASAYFGGITASAEDTLRQALMINAITDAASENSKQAGNAITYAETRALLQQNNTFDVVGKLAIKLLPIMKAVIEALAYACFIFIIPLCMIPRGWKFLINWLKVLVWLQAWPPMYAILNFIMNVAARSATLAQIGTAGGLTIGNYIGVSEANHEIQLMAGYLAMSIPFICIAIVQGIGSFVHLSAQMTGASMQVAGAAASEISTGNISLGNLSLRNHSADNISQLQRNYNSSLGIGGHTVDTGTVQIRNDAIENRFTVTRGVSSGARDLSMSAQEAQMHQMGYQMNKREALEAGRNLTKGRQLSKTQSMKLVESFSEMKAQDISSKYGIGTDKANQIAQDARMLDSYYKGEAFHDQTQTSGNLSASGNFGFNTGTPANINNDNGKSKSAFKGWGGQVGGSLSGGVSATNSDNTGSTKQFNSSEDISEVQRRFESNMKEISNSSRKDNLTQLARDHVKTLQENESLSNTQAYSESQAQMHLNGFNESVSVSSTDRMNLIDSALQVAYEKGIDGARASRMIDNHDPQTESWFKTAKTRASVRNTLPLMKQPIPADWSNAGTQMQNDFGKSEQEMKGQIANDSAWIDANKETLNDRRNISDDAISNAINDSENAIKSKEDLIRNSSDSLKNDVAERASKSSRKAVWDKLWK
ncbi:MAG: conjugal transfer protein TraG N-terminal domain-containing protein [Alphaproteobacteria bacterium]|nr:conjugal transfer protein TraG N-terminal domain-containing protein [Alphaproteobacteria bacterium]